MVLFQSLIPARIVRAALTYVLTCVLEEHPEVGLESYDRIIPCQDTLPRGGFGSLVVLPLQAEARKVDRSVFVNDDWVPYADQWDYLSSVTHISRVALEVVIRKGCDGRQLFVTAARAVADGVRPWDFFLPLWSADLNGEAPAVRAPIADVSVVLSDRREHIEVLARLLEGRVRHVVVLMGGMGARQMRMARERLAVLPDAESRVILATGSFLGEGFDDARLDTLFLALPVSWKGRLTQFAGRLHRLRDGKREVRIYDYSVRRLCRDGLDEALANLFVRATLQINLGQGCVGRADAAQTARAFLFARLESYAVTKGFSQSNVRVPIPCGENPFLKSICWRRSAGWPFGWMWRRT